MQSPIRSSMLNIMNDSPKLDNVMESNKRAHGAASIEPTAPFQAKRTKLSEKSKELETPKVGESKAPDSPRTKSPDLSVKADETSANGADNSVFTFPERLMELLDNGTEEEAMWWLDDGDGFCVLPKLFPERVLDRHFQGTKFESFTRKLNRWGFKRAAGQHIPPNTIAYYHHMFLRGKPELLKNMSGGKRQKDGKSPSSTPRKPRKSNASAKRSGNTPAQDASSGGPAALFPGGVGAMDFRNQALASMGVGGAVMGGMLNPGRGDDVFLPQTALGMGMNPLDQDLRLQSFLMAQQNADLLRQQQARVMAEIAASEQQANIANELRLRRFAGGPSDSGLSSRMLLAAAAQQPAAPGIPVSLSSQGYMGLPGSLGQQIDPELLQLIIERERQRQQQG